MSQPAKKPEAPPATPQGGARAAAGPEIAAVVAADALKRAKGQAPDQEKMWEEMGSELYDAFEKKDRSNFGKLFRQQIQLAVREAIRGNKR